MKRNFDDQSMDTVLADDIDCKGKLTFKKDLLIKGKFEGKIETNEGHLYIGNKSEVISDLIKIKNLSNQGKIYGNIEASGIIEQYRGSIIEGDIVTPDLYIESGSKFNGNCTMIDINKK